MGYIVKSNTEMAVIEESVAGEFEEAAGANFIRAMNDGVELNPGFEVLERDVMDGSIGRSAHRMGMQNVEGSVQVEAKASGTPGTEPEYGVMLKSVLGAVTKLAAQVTSKASGNTASVLALEDADVAKFALGEIVTVLESGAYHTSPIKAIVTTSGSATIELEFAADDAFSNSVKIEKCVNYKSADSGHVSFSVSKFLESAIKESAWGCYCSSVSLEDFSVGQYPKLSFGFSGMGYNQEVEALALTPAYDDCLPPIVLDATVLKDGVAICVQSVSLSVENALAWVQCMNEESGRLSARVASRSGSGSFSPYKADDSVANYTDWAAVETFSLFLKAKIPTSTAGQYEDVFAVWCPQCVIEGLAQGDSEGLVTDEISFRTNVPNGTNAGKPEIVIGFPG